MVGLLIGLLSQTGRQLVRWAGRDWTLRPWGENSVS